jgi:hypothetical protein
MKLVIVVDEFSKDEGKYDQDYRSYVVNDFRITDFSQESLQKEVDRIVALAKLEHRDLPALGEDFYSTTVCDWSIEDDDYVTHYDRQEDEHDRDPQMRDMVRYWSPTIDQETGKVFRKIRGYDGRIYINDQPVEETA